MNRKKTRIAATSPLRRLGFSGVVLLAFIHCLHFTPQASAAAAVRPNFVFILADDLGWRDLGCYGSTFYETPNIDRLAARGVRFTQAYAACSVCSPTRASILTGKYPARLHLTDWVPGRPDRPDQKLNHAGIVDHLPLEETTLAEALRAGGYQTAFFGKWHLGGEGYFPEQQGFDLNVGGCDKGAPPSYFSPYKIPNLTDGPKGEYLTDRLTDEALRFLERSKGNPFLLYLSHYAVHNPQALNLLRTPGIRCGKFKIVPFTQRWFKALTKALDASWLN